MPKPDLYLGLLSGTSLDNIDAAIFQFNNHSPKCEMIENVVHPIPQDIKQQSLSLCLGAPCTLEQLGTLDKQWGKLFAASVKNILKKAKLSAQNIKAIGCHGQTLWHQPNHRYPFSLQIGDPNVIAKETGITTIADFRRGDMAVNGQGAPLAPNFHHFMFQSPVNYRVIINLGGIANITILDKDPHAAITGYDTGPANGLLDEWIFKHKQQPFDKNGNWAKSGIVKPDLLHALLKDNYFAKPFPKSTGKDYFNLNWLQQKLNLGEYQAKDIQATLVELTAITLKNEITKHVLTADCFICGGGTHNAFLLSRIQHHLGDQFTVKSTETIDLAPDWVEAALFAWLAKARIEETPINTCSITNATHATILGGQYLP